MPPVQAPPVEPPVEPVQLTEEETAALSSPRIKSTFDPALFAVPGEMLPTEVKNARAAAGFPVAGVEFKSLPTEIAVADGKRRVELWVAAYGNVDDGGDVIPYGAAAKSIKRDGPSGARLIKFFWNHTMLLGPAVTVEEHKRGVLFVGEIDDARELDRYHAHAKSGAACHGSIGYVPKRASRVQIEGKTARSLDEIDLLEGSLVIWPMNRQATVEQVKSLYAAAQGLRCLAEIRACERQLAAMVESDEEWNRLTAEEAAEAVELIGKLTKTAEKSRLLALRRAGAPTHPEEAKAALRAYVASLRG